MPATACFRSRPLRKIKDGIGRTVQGSALSRVCDLPYVWRERVEGLQLARVRPFEGNLQVRQERIVVGHVGLAAAAGGDRRHALRARAARVGQVALSAL